MGLNSTVVRRAFTASVVTFAVSVTPLFAAIAQAVTLNGAGATFPAPLYERYIREFKSKNPGVTVNYQGIGSGGGIKQMQAGSVDFAGSDSAITDEQIDKLHQNRGVLMVPTAGGAVAIVYNGIAPGLKLSQSALGEIFGGKITQWNDPAIAKTNPGMSLPDRTIRLVVRADSSGTTFITTNALSAMSPFFKGKVGVSSAPKWGGKPIQGKGNPGVAESVKQTPNSIGYVEYAFAKQNNMQMAAIQNKKGEFVMPSLETTQEALSNIKFPANFRVFEGNPAAGYPIAGLTWMLVYKKYDAEKLPAIKDWVRWVLNDGQKINPTLDYVPIPPSVRTRVLQQLEANVKAQ
ncbi:phosphate ABC transporter substrate-binding protein PstS [Altericista sp. CCNU0014]|uniref:phosphate ABC transporter substrate-binding protein PstS n=1 Tax=Altericista sp. CCNU0014 TaxID=3082949 RepID=UPI003851423A